MKNKQNIVLLTNNISWTADHISQLYRARWAIESFFKQLKQLFSVKTFVGLSENAVQIQIWCSLIAILLLMYIKNKAKYPAHVQIW
ncbi:MAG: transposase [Saprospiraceae bacterium]|nr:transposase [Saprospiraceae bacterium]